MSEPYGTHRCASCGQVIPGLNTAICPGCAAAADREDKHRVVVKGLEKAFQAGTQAQEKAEQKSPPASVVQRFDGPIDPEDRYGKDEIQDGDIWEPRPGGVAWVRRNGRWVEE